MKSFQLTPVAKARVWFNNAVPRFIPTGFVSGEVAGDPVAPVKPAHVTIEAFVPRGGRTEYGLLSITFARNRASALRVEVPYSEGRGDPCPDSLANEVDDVRLGLPQEYAGPILEAILGFGKHRFPPGTIAVVGAAHGLVGSSVEFFRRLAATALILVVDDNLRQEDDMVSLLKGALVDNHASPAPTG